MSDTDVCMISRNDLQEFLLKYPTISLKILSEFFNRLETSEKQTTRFATEKVDTRFSTVSCRMHGKRRCSNGN